MYRISLLTSRITAHRAATRPQRRTLATVPPSGSDRRDAFAAYGGNTALLVGGVAALAGIAWYMTRGGDRSPPSASSVQRQARDTAQTKAQVDTHEVKSKMHEEYDRARSGADAAVDKTKGAARDLRVSAEQKAASVRDTVLDKSGDVKHEVERETQKVKDRGNGWFNWGKSTAEEYKNDATKGVVRKAENVRVEADKNVV